MKPTFDLTALEIEIQERFPVSIKFIQNILTRIHEQYPLADRTTIAVVVKAFFELLRQSLIEGKVITLEGYFTKFQLGVSYRQLNGRSQPRLRVKMNTPRGLRKCQKI